MIILNEKIRATVDSTLDEISHHPFRLQRFLIFLPLPFHHNFSITVRSISHRSSVSSASNADLIFPHPTLRIVFPNSPWGCTPSAAAVHVERAAPDTRNRLIKRRSNGVSPEDA